MTTESLSWIDVYLVPPGGHYHVSLEHWDEIDAAYHHWIERRIDRVLTLTCADSEPLMIAASRVGEFSRSTPEGRARGRVITDAVKAETGFVE